MNATEFRKRVSSFERVIDKATSLEALAVFTAAAQTLEKRYGARIAAEILYSAADEAADKAPREWSL